LRNGAPARIRPLRTDDVQRFGAFVGQLSEGARGCPFHAGIGDCEPAMLQQLVSVDGVRQVALVATLALADGEALIGEARYGVREPAGSAELAIAVADPWQGQGVADHLIDGLLEAARDAGLRRLYVDVLASHTGLIGVLHRMGFQTRAQGTGGGLLRLERGVAPRTQQPQRRPLGALRRWLAGQFVPRP
jgi:acetyltransferase